MGFKVNAESRFNIDDLAIIKEDCGDLKCGDIVLIKKGWISSCEIIKNETCEYEWTYLVGWRKLLEGDKYQKVEGKCLYSCDEYIKKLEDKIKNVKASMEYNEHNR